MEDDATKEDLQPSTSKKDSQRSNSRIDLYDHDRGGRDGGASNSETSVSATYSARSQAEMLDARPEPPKPSTNLGKRESKAPEKKKKRGRRGGRVEKRRRSYRRHLRRAPLRRKRGEREGLTRQAKPGERRHREHSMSTIFSRLTSRSGSKIIGCAHCGHRCCRRRAKRFVFRVKRFTCRRSRSRNCGRRAKKLKKKPKLKPQCTALSKEIQMGSRSHMLSPLFINTNSTPEGKVIVPEQTYCEVTPEMIFESVRVLSLWRDEVPTILLMKYIVRNYPVNKEEGELLVELTEKLRIAAIVGIVMQTNEDLWALADVLEQRRLTLNHVTLFWQVYSDTLSPISRKERRQRTDSSI